MTNRKNKINVKDIKMDPTASLNEDTGFCSSEESNENEFHSSTESSEDSVEVKVKPITLSKNNHNNSNRKRALEQDNKKLIAFTGPLKKRMCLKIKAEENGVISTPFRPWSPNNCDNSNNSSQIRIKNEIPSLTSVTHPLPTSIDSKDFFLETSPATTTITTVKSGGGSGCCFSAFSHIDSAYMPSLDHGFEQTEPVSLVINREKINSPSTKLNSNNNHCDIRVPPIHPEIMNLSTSETEHLISRANEQFPGLQKIANKQLAKKMNSDVTTSAISTVADSIRGIQQTLKKADQKRENRNYKNMTRERRMEANARERTRVHTISAAFETLRAAIPSYSNNQKLSKLSILRIACSYIMTLSNFLDDSVDGAEETSIEKCIEAVSNTIQKEGKLRKKKDDND